MEKNAEWLKAEWLKPGYAEEMRRRMMMPDASKIDPLLDPGAADGEKVGVAAGVGVAERSHAEAEGVSAAFDSARATKRAGLNGVRERQEKSLSISMIERNLESRDNNRSGKAQLESPVSSLGEPVTWDVKVVAHALRDEANVSTRGHGGASLTAMPSPRSENATLVNGGRYVDCGLGWKVFRGKSEIQSYEAKKDVGGEGRKGLGRIFGRWF